MVSKHQPLATFPAQRTRAMLARYALLYAAPLAVGLPIVLLLTKRDFAATLLFAVVGAGYMVFNLYIWSRMRYQVYPNHFVFRFGARRLVYHWSQVTRVWREDRRGPELRGQFPPGRAVDTVLLEVNMGEGKSRIIEATPQDCAGLLAAIRQATPRVPVGKPLAAQG